MHRLSDKTNSYKATKKNDKFIAGVFKGNALANQTERFALTVILIVKFYCTEGEAGVPK